MDTTEGYYVYAEGVTRPIDPCPKGGHHCWNRVVEGVARCQKCDIPRTFGPPPTEQVPDQETWDKWIHARYEDLVKNYIDDEGDGSLTFDDFCTNEWVKSQEGQQVSNLDTDRPNRCKVCNCDPEWCTCKKPEEICRDSGHNWVGHGAYRVHCKRCGELSKADVDQTPKKNNYSITIDPSYRDLIEVPEHYHLWRDNELRRVFLTVPLDNDDLLRDGPQYPSGTWLRKFAFSDLVWDDLVAEDARSCDDGEARAIIQGCVNDIVAEWRERFGAP